MGVQGRSREKRGECLSRVPEGQYIRVTVASDQIGAMASHFHNFVETAFGVRELDNSAQRGVRMDLDMGHNQIATSKSDRRAGIVHTGLVSREKVLL
jgi:hypothetical protein